MKHLLRRLLAAVACLVFTAALVASGRLTARYVHTAAERGAAPAFEVPVANAQELTGSARIARTLTYTSLDAPGAGEATATIAWDDAWFAQDETAYNHELARAASVIAALAYAESGHYQSPESCPPYMENALSDLGFSEIDTDSYRFRSEVVDEVLNIVTSDTDVVAYTIARKHVEAATTARDIIVVSVRGSYGSEWLSNLDLSRDEGGDHGGYVRAAQEITEQVKPWVAASRLAGSEVSVLLVGHSRGGAVANLVAAELDDGRATGVNAIEHVYAYTFASPATTLSATARDARYDNIFNIINPADVMPSLPLEAWGYERYGVDVSLPEQGRAGFDELDERMRAEYASTVGVACAADGSDAQVIDEVVSDIANGIASVEELITPKGMLEVARSMALRVNPVRMLYSHYPSTYICWMQVTSEGDMVRMAS